MGIAKIRLGRAVLLQGRYADAEMESRSGYDILMKQSTPPANWLQEARKDLVEEYAAMRQDEKAAQFRAEMADAGKGPDVTGKK